MRKPSHYMHFHCTLIKINTLLDIPDQHRNIVQFHTDASVFVFPLAIILFSSLFVCPSSPHCIVYRSPHYPELHADRQKFNNLLYHEFLYCRRTGLHDVTISSLLLHRIPLKTKTERMFIFFLTANFCSDILFLSNKCSIGRK